jgi:hypothetical protein
MLNGTVNAMNKYVKQQEPKERSSRKEVKDTASIKINGISLTLRTNYWGYIV